MGTFTVPYVHSIVHTPAMKRAWTDAQRTAIQGAIDELVPTGQTGVLRDDLVAAIRAVMRRRRENSRLGQIVLNALHDDSGSWPTVSYLTGLSRMRAVRWGDKVIEDDEA